MSVFHSAAAAFLISLCFFTSSPPSVQSKSITDDHNTASLLYLSPTTFFPNYQKMLTSFKIYIYALPQPQPPPSLLFSSLQNSPFVTQNPEEAHLFFLPFSSSDLPSRSIARVVRDTRMRFPYWNRTLGADHFYVSCAGLGYESDRNLLELKKNSVRISCFPALDGRFVPHKDITFPPFNAVHALHAPVNNSREYFGFVKQRAVQESSLVNELRSDTGFFMESEPSDETTLVERLVSSKFCLFEYGADLSTIGDALRFGCMPVVVTDRPMQDLPLMDVLRWQEFALFVGSSDDGAEGMKRVVRDRCKADSCEGMRRLGVAASKHLVWNETPQPYDAFHMVMYQLWLRRHTIRYTRVPASAE